MLDVWLFSTAKFGETGRVCTVEQLNEIKQALIPTFNENFSNKLMEITKVRSDEFFLKLF